MSEATLIEFPCRFPIKIIGDNTEAFITNVVSIAKAHDTKFSETDLVKKNSTESKYVALTLHVDVHSQMELDALYQQLTKLPSVKMVL